MNFKEEAALDIKIWFCSKSDEELSEYLINHLVNGDENSTFRKWIPTKIANNWIISLQLLSGKRIFLPNTNVAEYNKSKLLELQLRYKNSTHIQLDRIRSEFVNYIDTIKC